MGRKESNQTNKQTHQGAAKAQASLCMRNRTRELATRIHIDRKRKRLRLNLARVQHYRLSEAISTEEFLAIKHDISLNGTLIVLC